MSRGPVCVFQIAALAGRALLLPLLTSRAMEQTHEAASLPRPLEEGTPGAEATWVWTTSGAEPLSSLNAQRLTCVLERRHALDTSPQGRVLKS